MTFLRSASSLIYGGIIASFLAFALPAYAEGAGELAEGARVFSEIAGIGCKTCHGEYAEGDLGVGPFIRGATEGAIRASIDATGEMGIIRNTITDQEISAVSAYLGYLGTMQVSRTLAKRGRFIPATFDTRPGTRMQVIIQNAGLDAHVFRSDNMRIAEITIPARSSGFIEWQASDAEGEFTFYCTDCKLKNQFFTIQVDAAAAEFKGARPAANVVADDSM